MTNLEKAKQVAEAEIKNVRLPNGKNNKALIAKILKALTAAHILAGCTPIEAENHAANFIMNRC